MPVSVDLPIPGAPPRRTSEPGTRPPPKTRSSSATPVSRRGTAGACTSRRGTARGGATLRRRWPAPAGSARASTSVFHSPQPAHRPDHARAEWPHDWQTYRAPERAMASTLRTPPDATAPPGGRLWDSGAAPDGAEVDAVEECVRSVGTITRDHGAGRDDDTPAEV